MRSYCWRAVCLEEVFVEDELTAGIGGAAPATSEPSPSCCKVLASNLPVGFRPCVSWNLFTASTVEASHLPLGVPLNEPSLPKACWISVIRSEVGAFCPLRLDLLEDLPRREVLLDFEEACFLCEALCGLAAGALTPSPAATSSVRARWVAFRTRMGVVTCVDPSYCC